MGEIIKFPDLGGKGPGREEEVNPNRLVELLTLVTGLISAILGNPRGEAYRAKHDLVSSYTNAEIAGWINNFDARSVAASPLFYSALIDISRERKLFKER